MDKTEFKQCDTLIYFGCYIFSNTGAQFKTIELADKLGIDYEVLGGLKSCCGWPQLMGGRIEESEYLHRYVADVIEQIQPKEVITGCMECFASLKRMLQIKRTDWKALTTSQWMLNHADQLGLSKNDELITFHDSCHCTRKLGLGDPARKLIGKMYDLEEMDETRDEALCCGYYNFKANPELNHHLRQKKMDMAKKTGAQTMAVECITCQESFESAGQKKGVVVTDLVDLVHKNVFSKDNSSS
ncbi:MAG: (Fe-S)-binding protein [SAR324 cluster bacterium]|nr:(Fe-S)-binding protein [SAR324 cluster bacterium]